MQDSGALPSEAVEACLATVSKQVQTLREIAGEFSTFARLPELAPETLDAGELMREVIAPYVSARPRDVTIEERYEPTHAVSADRRVLGRALVNVVENALEAMPEGGTLTVSVTPAPENRQVVFAIRDTGTGIEPEIHRRLFEPYFSTKSSGTGLGLAIVRRAVEAHRGTIEVDTLVDGGTTVRILLPTIAH